MKNETLKKAYDRLIADKPRRTELEILKAWAKQEIGEWTKFLELVQGKINKLK